MPAAYARSGNTPCISGIEIALVKGRDTPADGAFTLISGKAINLPTVFDIENDSSTERQQYSVRRVCLRGRLVRARHMPAITAGPARPAKR